MIYHLLTFSDEKFKSRQNDLCDYARRLDRFASVIEASPKDYTNDFISDNTEILGRERGCGYWLWKPWIILKTLEAIPEGEVVFYLDCGDRFVPEALDVATSILEYDDILLLSGHVTQRVYTKRDCFFYMGLDSERYWNAKQVEAGAIFVKKTEESQKIITEWLQYCRDPRILTDDENVCGLTNFPEFVDHRHDQSVLGNIARKYNLEMFDRNRKLIQCNSRLPPSTNSGDFPPRLEQPNLKSILKKK